ncbi:MAG TPA: choice-of-anchor D domain-containing protein [Gemmatimonadaceae bacterium]|nr:choice-of-anchor D domain-containing protein [Gemmatimonadaceae bacterium]
MSPPPPRLTPAPRAWPRLVSSLSIGGANPSDFSIVSDNCTGVWLYPSQSCTASVSFGPTRIGARSATLTIASNASAGPAAVSFSGTGAKPAGGGWTP